MVVFLLFAALVMDVGNWFSHKRQLQNRADAGALAAGVEYQTSWPSCIAGDAATATRIGNNARAFAGDPNPTTPVITPVNTETANQANLSVYINSTSYDAAMNDGGGPCFNHPADPNDPISPAGGYWTDVKVKERDLGSFFGSLGIPLSRNIARARVEIHPAISLNGFLPLAVPDRRIVKAQIRYWNECDNTLLATADLNALPIGYQTTPGLSLWAPTAGNPALPAGVNLTLPSALTGCPSTQDYVPVGVEVRFTSEPNVDINASCPALVAAKYADCFHRVSQFRAYPPLSSTANAPRIRAVSLAGCSPDGYFSRSLTDTCSLAVSATISWGALATTTAGLTVQATTNGNTLDLTTAGPSPSGAWTGSGLVTQTASGSDTAPYNTSRNPIKLTIEDTNTTHTWGSLGACKSGNKNPCKSTVIVHESFVATDASAGLADLVRTSLTQQGSGGQPQAAYDGGPLGALVTVYPTLGLRIALATGDFTVLRQSGSQATQLLDCEPPGGGGISQIRQEFAKGCITWYGKNPFTQGNWWDVSTQTCPGSTTFFKTPNPPGTDPYTNSASNPFRCVPTVPGSVGNPVSDGIKIRTGNCVGNVNLSSYTCQGNPPCSNPNTYDPLTKTFAPGDKQRVVNLFIVPYQALKGIGGSNSTQVLPILGFAAFYVTGWKGPGSSADTCTTDPDGPTGPARPDQIPANNGEINGYFIEDVQPNTGPVDPNVTCVIGQLTPCRAVLVR